MKWLMVIAVYMAPADAVDWNGPWEIGVTTMSEDKYDSEAECRNEAVQMIGRLHQGMLAPMRFQCVPMPETLPEGAPR
jgi:hypothetical protein